MQHINDTEYRRVLTKILLTKWPEATIVTPEILQSYHKKDEVQVAYMEKIAENHPDAVWYYLPKSTSGAIDGYYCNGCQYHDHEADYISFPQIKPEKLK